MDRETLRPVALAVLCVLAIGLAAATLNSTVSTDEGSGIGLGPADGVGTDGGQPSANLSNDSRGVGGLGSAVNAPCFPVLTTARAIAAILAVFALGAAVAYWRAGPFGTVAYAGPVGIAAVFAHALLTGCVSSSPEGDSGLLPSLANQTQLPLGGSGGLGDGAAVSPSAPSILLVALLGVALVGAVALLFKSTGGDPDEDPEVADAPTEEVRAAVGTAAGEAADRIEADAAVENEVFRAWREMTAHLDVANPESSTPAEFAAAAVDAGMAREDVTELTDLFEAVRYGGESPTGDREARAVAALRNIEAEYAEDDDD